MSEAKPQIGTPVPARPASTVLLVRDGEQGIEVFMVVRNRQIEFAGGALVFPGGRVEKDDEALGGAEPLDGFRIAGIRETFEECGVLLARPRGEAALVDAVRLLGIEALHRARVARGEQPLSAMLAEERLEPAIDGMVQFAHWVTPLSRSKRFDTQFFLAAAPPDQLAVHDGHESEDSVWITPARAIEEANAGQRRLVFPDPEEPREARPARDGGRGAGGGAPGPGGHRHAGDGADRAGLAPDHPGRGRLWRLGLRGAGRAGHLTCSAAAEEVVGRGERAAGVGDLDGDGRRDVGAIHDDIGLHRGAALVVKMRGAGEAIEPEQVVLPAAGQAALEVDDLVAGGDRALGEHEGVVAGAPWTREVPRPKKNTSSPAPAAKFSVPAPARTSSARALPQTVWASVVGMVAASRWTGMRALVKS
ncbi:NUDIX hydrolase [Dankookia sp. P2]|uniref:NUDIX hydrolase n=1 Tax=Dankookia sp. P2 TaxID=3423955 RepID=UPI003D66A9D7